MMHSYTYEELKVCRVCLDTDMKLLDLNKYGLAGVLSAVAGIQMTPTDGLPQRICIFCWKLLQNASDLIDKCRNTQELLSNCLLQVNCLTTAYIKAIDRTNFKLPLITAKVHIDSYIKDDVIDTELFKIKEESVTDSPSNNIDYDDENTSDDFDKRTFERTCQEDSDKIKNIEDGNENNTNCSKEEVCEDYNVSLKKQCGDDFVVELSNVDDDIENQESIPCFRGLWVSEGPSLHFNKIGNQFNKGSRKNNDLNKGRIKEFNEKYLDNACEDKKVFYEYVLNKYVKKTKHCKMDELHFDIETLEEVKTETKPTDVSKLNENQKKLHQFIENKYHKGKTIDGNIQETHNLTRIKKNMKVTRSKEISKFSEACKVDVILLDKEQQIEDLLSRREKDNYQKAVFKCELCCRGFTQLNAFQNHSAVHDEKTRPQECEVCHVRFKNRAQLSKHTHLRHTYKYICRLCGQVTRTRTCAREHYKIHEGCKYPCEHCDKVFSKYNSRINHIRIFHGAVTCDICHERFVGEAGLAAHKSLAHREIFRCPGCGVQFHNADALRRHEDSAVDGCGPHVRPCTQCGENFSNAELMEAHTLQNHNKKRNANTRMCYQTLKLPSAPRANVKWVAKRGHKSRNEVNGEEEENGELCKKKMQNRLMCEMCGADGFFCEAALRYHQRKHTGEKPYACPHCPKTFRIKDFLDVHTKTRGHRCHVCDKAFRTPICVKIHLKSVHMKINP